MISTLKNLNKIEDITIFQPHNYIHIIQSIIAIKYFIAENPKIKIILIINKKYKNCSTIIKQINLEKIYFLDFSNYDKIYTNNKNIIEKINNQNNELFINLSYDVSNIILTKYIRAKKFIGPYINIKKQFIINEKWMKFYYSNFNKNNIFPFSLVEIYKNTVCSTKEYYFKSNNSKKYIIISPFVNASHKYFSYNQWIDIIYSFLKSNNSHDIYIINNIKDTSLLNNKTLKQYKNRIKPLIADFNSTIFYKIISNASIVIGHNSSYIHYASLLSVKTITFISDTYQKYLTSYGEGNYIISPSWKYNMSSFHSTIPTTVASDIIIKILNNNIEDIPKNYQNYIRLYKKEKNKNNNIIPIELIVRNTSIDEIFSIIYRIIWLRYCSDIEEVSCIPNISKSDSEILSKYSEGINYLYELSEFGKKYTEYIIKELTTKTPRINVINSLAEKIIEIEELNIVIKEKFPMLAPLINFFQYHENILKSKTMDQANSASILFDAISILSQAMNDLISKIINYQRQAKATTIPTKRGI